LINLSPDTHPIHLHQVRFQILDRQPILVPAYLSSKTLSFRGPAVPPAAHEAGWKDTVRVESRGVTRIIVRFDVRRQISVALSYAGARRQRDDAALRHRS